MLGNNSSGENWTIPPNARGVGKGLLDWPPVGCSCRRCPCPMEWRVLVLGSMRGLRQLLICLLRVICGFSICPWAHALMQQISKSSHTKQKRHDCSLSLNVNQRGGQLLRTSRLLSRQTLLAIQAGRGSRKKKKPVVITRHPKQ